MNLSFFSLLLSLFSSCWVAVHNFNMIDFALIFYFIILGCYLWGSCSILMRERQDIDLKGRGGRKMEIVEGRETIIRIYYIRKQSIFNKRKNSHACNQWAVFLASRWIFLSKISSLEMKKWKLDLWLMCFSIYVKT